MLKKFFLVCAFIFALSLPAFGQGFPPLRVSELDGSPDVKGVYRIKFPNGTLSNVGGVVTYTPGASGGTVTTVSVTTSGGVSGTVATATTTPAITLALGAITPTSVNGLTISTTTGTFTLTNAKTLSVSDNVTFASDGTGTRTLNVGTGGTLATAAYKATGTSGNTVPLLDGANTFSAKQTITVESTQTLLEINGGLTGSPLLGIRFVNGAGHATRLVSTNLNTGTPCVPWNGCFTLAIYDEQADKFSVITSPVAVTIPSGSVFGISSAADGTSADDVGLSRISAGVVGAGTGLVGSTAGEVRAALFSAPLGGGFSIGEGTNGWMGRAVCNGSTEVTVTTNAVHTASEIFYSFQVPGGTPLGIVFTSARSDGVSFGFKCAIGDTSTVAWEIKKPF